MKCKCGKELKYNSDYAAPGYGQCWICPGCNKSYTKIGAQFYDDTCDPDAFIMTKSDVI